MDSDTFFNKHAGADDEVFEDLKGYEGLYLMSSKGYAISLRTDKVLELRIGEDGYIGVNVEDAKGNRKYINLQILMVKTFLKKYESDKRLIVDHINGIKTDNRLENLRYITDSGNGKNAYNTGDNPGPTAAKKIVCKLDEFGNVIKRYNSISEAARKNNIKRIEGIIRCCHNQSKNYTCHGFGWRYSKLNKKKEKKIVLEEDKVFKQFISNEHQIYFSMYEISNYGKIRNMETKEYITTPIRGGYYTLCLTNDNDIRITKTFIYMWQ